MNLRTLLAGLVLVIGNSCAMGETPEEKQARLARSPNVRAYIDVIENEIEKGTNLPRITQEEEDYLFDSDEACKALGRYYAKHSSKERFKKRKEEGFEAHYMLDLKFLCKYPMESRRGVVNGVQKAISQQSYSDC